jgi:phosphatidylglycerol:prolipoprotein diacylglycerol transferase
MTFPVYIHLFGYSIHPHLFFESIAYFIGFQFFLFLRRNHNPTVSFEDSMWLIIGCIFGALFGSKILAWFESPRDYWNHRDDFRVLVGGKSIVGGLLGGWIGVEFVKKRLRIFQQTGNVYVFPLLLGISIGRIGCFLTGLDDRTFGIRTHLSWGVDFGDRIYRHPTQLYEICFLLSLGVVLFFVRNRFKEAGSLFRLFILSYLLFRFFIEFIKPRFGYFCGLSAIQITSLIGASVSFLSLKKIKLLENSKNSYV